MYYSLFFKVSSLTLTKFVENVLTIHVQINKIWDTCSLCILTVHSYAKSRLCNFVIENKTYFKKIVWRFFLSDLKEIYIDSSRFNLQFWTYIKTVF